VGCSHLEHVCQLGPRLRQRAAEALASELAAGGEEGGGQVSDRACGKELSANSGARCRYGSRATSLNGCVVLRSKTLSQ
jgi:hypothetical protein